MEPARGSRRSGFVPLQSSIRHGSGPRVDGGRRLDDSLAEQRKWDDSESIQFCLEDKVAIATGMLAGTGRVLAPGLVMNKANVIAVLNYLKKLALLSFSNLPRKGLPSTPMDAPYIALPADPPRNRRTCRFSRPISSEVFLCLNRFSRTR